MLITPQCLKKTECKRPGSAGLGVGRSPAPPMGEQTLVCCLHLGLS